MAFVYRVSRDIGITHYRRPEGSSDSWTQCSSPGDTSPGVFGNFNYAPEGRLCYDSRCGCCYLGISHTEEIHLAYLCQNT